jgi:5,10-methylenetetrahydromethanopterin reductase
MPKRLRLGVRLHSGIAVRQAIELGKHAETCGFHSVWMAENPFERGVLPTIAVIATETQRIRLGVGVVNAFNRHPTLMAMETCALAELAPGRFALGIGSGVAEAVTRMGFPYDRPVSAVADAGRIVRGLLAGQTVTHTGSVFKVDGVKLAQSVLGGPIPIFFAAMADRALRITGELADGLLIGNMCPPSFTDRALARIREGALVAGRQTEAIEIIKYVPCALGPDALASAKNVIGRLLGAYWQFYAQSPKVRATMMEGNDIEPAQFMRCLESVLAGRPGSEVLDDSFVTAYAVAGTLEECEAQCHRLQASGVSEVALSFVGPHPAADMHEFSALLRSSHDSVTHQATDF